MSSRGVTALSALLVLGLGLPFVVWRRDQAAHPSVPAFDPALTPTTADVQGLDQLWRALSRLRDQTRLDAEEFRTGTVDRTLEFLELETEQQAGFGIAVDAALRHLVQARARLLSVNRDAARDPEPDDSILARREAWSRWQEEQRHAADGLLAVLPPTPRQQLLADERLIWLLRLDSGMQAARDREP